MEISLFRKIVLAKIKLLTISSAYQSYKQIFHCFHEVNATLYFDDISMPKVFTFHVRSYPWTVAFSALLSRWWVGFTTKWIWILEIYSKGAWVSASQTCVLFFQVKWVKYAFHGNVVSFYHNERESRICGGDRH